MFYTFLTTADEVEKYVQLVEKTETKIRVQSSSSGDCLCCYNIKIMHIYDPELQLINTKHVIKNKLKDLFGDLRKFKALKMLLSEYKKRDDHISMHNIFNSV